MAETRCAAGAGSAMASPATTRSWPWVPRRPAAASRAGLPRVSAIGGTGATAAPTTNGCGIDAAPIPASMSAAGAGSNRPLEGPGQVSLHGVPVLVVVQVLYGLQQRTRDGAITDAARLRQIAGQLRRAPAGLARARSTSTAAASSTRFCAASRGMSSARSSTRRPNGSRTCGTWPRSGCADISPSPRSARVAA